MYAEYILEELSELYIESRPYKQGSLSLDNLYILVRFVNDELPWEGKIEDLTSEGANALFNSEKYTPPVPLEEKVMMKKSTIASERLVAEHSGIAWTDSDDETYAFDTTEGGQLKLIGAQVSMSKGTRSDGGVWKCGHITSEGMVTVFREMTNSELSEVADLMNEHVQKCFEAEANTIALVDNGDLDASYQEELNKLNS
jgi:hypothetical protein